MFKPNKLYIQLKRNQVTIINLINGDQAIETASIPFSTERVVLASFDPAMKAVKAALGKLGIKKSWVGTAIAIQQTEGAEGGLSDIEKRALQDIGELAGGKPVFIIEGEKPLTIDEALEFLRKPVR